MISVAACHTSPGVQTQKESLTAHFWAGVQTYKKSPLQHGVQMEKEFFTAHFWAGVQIRKEFFTSHFWAGVQMQKVTAHFWAGACPDAKSYSTLLG